VEFPYCKPKDALFGVFRFFFVVYYNTLSSIQFKPRYLTITIPRWREETSTVFFFQLSFVFFPPLDSYTDPHNAIPAIHYYWIARGGTVIVQLQSINRALTTYPIYAKPHYIETQLTNMVPRFFITPSPHSLLPLLTHLTKYIHSPFFSVDLGLQ
jgi:hypothetical protein